MSDLILSDEQTALLEGCDQPITVRDAFGRKVGELRVRGDSAVEEANPITADELAEIQRRMNSDGPWATTEEVLQRLKMLETK